MESELILSPREKSPLPEKNFPRGSNPWHCIKQDSKPNTQPTSYFGLPYDVHFMGLNARTFTNFQTDSVHRHMQQRRDTVGSCCCFSYVYPFYTSYSFTWRYCRYFHTTKVTGVKAQRLCCMLSSNQCILTSEVIPQLEVEKKILPMGKFSCSLHVHATLHVAGPVCSLHNAVKKQLRFPNHLVGLVDMASTSRAEDPGFESRLSRDFSGVESYQWLKTIKVGTPVDTLPGAWRYRVSAGAGLTSVSILWLGEMESLVCNFYLSVAAHKIEQIHPWDTREFTCCWDQPTNQPTVSPSSNYHCSFKVKLKMVDTQWKTHHKKQNCNRANHVAIS